MDAHQSGAESVRDDGGLVRANGGHLFHRFGFHIPVPDGCTWGGWAYVVLPNGPHEQAARCGGHHGTAVDDGVGVVRGQVDIFDNCLGADLGGLLRLR